MVSQVVSARRRREKQRAEGKYKKILLKARLYRRGMSEKEFNELIEKQNRMCAVCKKPLLLSVLGGCDFDHDHKTGKNRGLLCRSCNFFIGWIEANSDRIDILESIRSYLDLYK